MLRTPFVLGATIAGLVGVLSYDVHTKSFGVLNPGGAAALTQSRRPVGHSAPPGPASGQHSSGQVPQSPTPALVRQSTGRIVPYGYGQLAVKVQLLGSRITAVTVVGLRTAEQYSQSLANQVMPILRTEVLQAQSANISAVSGATYTSEAFASSLQSALTALGA